MEAATPRTCPHMTEHAGCVWETRTWSDAPDFVPTRCAGCPDAGKAEPASKPDASSSQSDPAKRFFQPN